MSKLTNCSTRDWIKCLSLQVALACIPHGRRECILALSIWALLLGFAAIARFILERSFVHGISVVTRSPRLPCHRYEFRLREGHQMLRLVRRTGTIGFLATYWAMRRLYSAIRVD